MVITGSEFGCFPITARVRPPGLISQVLFCPPAFSISFNQGLPLRTRASLPLFFLFFSSLRSIRILSWSIFSSFQGKGWSLIVFSVLHICTSFLGQAGPTYFGGFFFFFSFRLASPAPRPILSVSYPFDTNRLPIKAETRWPLPNFPFRSRLCRVALRLRPSVQGMMRKIWTRQVV